MTAYFFVAAAVIAVISVMLVVHLFVQKLIADPARHLEIQKSFILSIGLTKIIPVILLIWGMVKLTPVEGIEALYLPWGIIFVSVLVGFIFISRQKNSGENATENQVVNTLVSMSRPLLFSIPLLAVALLLLMLA